jgi:hypothetical protein
MNYTRLKKLFNQIVVVGKTKRTFFRRSKKFELQIYFTPVKNKIMVINIEGVDLDHPNLNVDFTVGGNIDDVFNWVEKNGHEITFQRIRFQI